MLETAGDDAFVRSALEDWGVTFGVEGRETAAEPALSADKYATCCMLTGQHGNSNVVQRLQYQDVETKGH